MSHLWDGPSICLQIETRSGRLRSSTSFKRTSSSSVLSTRTCEPGFEVFRDDPKLLDEAIDGAHADAAIDCGSCPGKDD